MQLLIKQRVFSWGDTFDIYDAENQPIFFVKGRVFSLGHVLEVFDLDGEMIGAVRQRLMTLLPAFELEAFGRPIGAVKKEFSLMRPKYWLDYNGWRVEGNILGWEYDVCDIEGKIVMAIDKQPFNWGDTYVINIEDERDTLPGLLTVLAIDAANCGND